MGRRPVIREQLAETLEDVKDTHGYGSLDEAISHICREAGYDV